MNVRGNQQRKTKGEREGDAIGQREIALLTVTLQAAGGNGRKGRKGKERGTQKRVEREQEPGLVRVSKERWREEGEKVAKMRKKKNASKK